MTIPPAGGDAFGLRTLFARSPGFAWRRIEIDAEPGGERVVSLVPGGELEIEVHGELGSGRPRLRLRRDSGVLVAGFALHRSRSLTIEGLEPGKHSIRVEIGPRFEARVLQEVRAIVVAGERTRVMLRVEAQPSARLVPFSGTLALPRVWALTSFALAFELIGPDAEGKPRRFRIDSSQWIGLAEGSELLHWTAPDSPPGRYRVGLDQLGFRSLVDLPEAGTSTAHIEVPPPCEVDVRCIDARTGAVASDVEIHWGAVAPDGSGRPSRAAARDAESELWHFRAPIGEIVLVAFSDTYEVEGSTHQVLPGRNEILMRLKRPCGLKPILRSGEKRIPWESNSARLPELVPLEGQAPCSAGISLGDQGHGVLFIRCHPGRYLLKVPPVEGFEAVSDEVVLLERGRIVEHHIQLRAVPR